MEKRLTMFLVSLLLCVGSALAQTKVSGTVLSQEDGQPIIGAPVGNHLSGHGASDGKSQERYARVYEDRCQGR